MDHDDTIWRLYVNFLPSETIQYAFWDNTFVPLFPSETIQYTFWDNTCSSQHLIQKHVYNWRPSLCFRTMSNVTTDENGTGNGALNLHAAAVPSTSSAPPSAEDSSAISDVTHGKSCRGSSGSSSASSMSGTYSPVNWEDSHALLGTSQSEACIGLVTMVIMTSSPGFCQLWPPEG